MMTDTKTRFPPLDFFVVMSVEHVFPQLSVAQVFQRLTTVPSPLPAAETRTATCARSVVGGVQPEGSSSRVCQKNGQWTGSATSCEGQSYLNS